MFKKSANAVKDHIVRNRAKYTAATVITAMLVIYGSILTERAETVDEFMKSHNLFDEWQNHLEQVA